MSLKTLQVRVKDKHAHRLREMAKSVNFVWNYCNDLSTRSIKDHGVFLSGFDMHSYTNGANKELGLHSQTLQEVAEHYAIKRKAANSKKIMSERAKSNKKKPAHKRKPVFKTKLRWRVSYGAKRSLGWIPIKKGACSWKNGQVYHNGEYFKVWDTYGLSDYEFKSANFREDARGRWYFNVVVEVEHDKSKGATPIGIDLGCKTAATVSNGDKLEGRWYRELEDKLAIAQRANNKKRAKAIHAKVANRRKDGLHKFSRKLVDENAAIFVGNVSATGMAKTRNGKSSLDAGWGMFKTMLEYKCHQAGVVFEEVNESYTTQICSSCGSLPDSRPRGIADTGLREWICSDCGDNHDRDINAAKNILAAGLGRLAGEKVAV